MPAVQKKFLQVAIKLALSGINNNSGGPFGCVVVKQGKVIGKGFNRVTRKNDPTAHAEIVAIREACRKLKSFRLNGCEIYCSCEPCPMCLGAIYWARISKVIYASTRKDAADAGFDDEFIYNELRIVPGKRKIKMKLLPAPESLEVFMTWIQKADKVKY